MTAKFLVVEIDDNNAAVELVQIMLERGFARLMLLDDLGKHPALAVRQHLSAITEPSTPSSAEPTFSNDRSSLRDILSSKPKINPFNTISENLLTVENEREMREGSELLDIIQFSGPEIITVGVKDDSDSVNDSFADNEEMTHGFNFNFSSNSQSHLDLLAQAHCLVSTTPCETPPSKKSKTAEVDPDKDYHQCQLCGTRVKAPRGGRWNLQMHVMAMHSSHRPYKCQQCDFQDYRKPGMRKHCLLSHGQDMDPVDISTEEKRTEWDSVMGRCFPEFAYRTGFLLDSRPNPTLPNTTTDSSV